MILKEQQLWKIECLKRYWLFFGSCAMMSFAACGGSKAPEGRTQITFYAGITADNGAVYKEMEALYNETQGAIDGVYVNYKPKASGYDSDLSTVFAGKNPPDCAGLLF